MSKYKVAEYQFDIYALFWEAGIKLLKPNGEIGFITPNTWLNNQSNKNFGNLFSTIQTFLKLLTIQKSKSLTKLQFYQSSQFLKIKLTRKVKPKFLNQLEMDMY
ncbi:MAG: Eco57I restriction-modification methylase domain-containing protein [Bacteroidetes bacterium]|nr:Eco57I restriction-modification methylase domain-containing protein [Bacteroidota bacterium]